MKNKELYINQLVNKGLTYADAKDFIDNMSADMLTSDISYYIKIDYTTGDSFSTYQSSDDIVLPWHNIGIVEENVKRLNQYFNFFSQRDYAYRSDTLETLKNQWYNAPWAVHVDSCDSLIAAFDYEPIDNKYIALHSIKLLKDDGTDFIISTISWTGYFECDQNVSICVGKEHE